MEERHTKCGAAAIEVAEDELDASFEQDHDDHGMQTLHRELLERGDEPWDGRRVTSRS